MPQSSSLSDRLGGTPAMKKTLDAFYDKVTKDATLGPFFKGVKQTTLKNHVLKFLRYYLADGRLTAEVTDVLLEKHMTLFEDHGLNEGHFDMFLDMLAEAFKETGNATDQQIEELHGLLSPLRQIFLLGAQEYASTRSDADASQVKAEKRKGIRKLLAGLSRKA